MSATLLDERHYRALLDVTLPVVIRTEEEHRRLNAAAALRKNRTMNSLKKKAGSSNCSAS